MSQGLLRRIKWKLLHWRVRHLNNRDWRERFKRIFDLHPHYKNPIDKEIEFKHRELWENLNSSINLDTIRVCYNISGKASPEIVPEEVYDSEIEKSLNRYEMTSFLSHKSVYDRWYGTGIFPETFIHNIEGCIYDGEYNRISTNQQNKIMTSLPYPVVLKPNMGSSGGYNVFFPADPQELRSYIIDLGKNYLVQRRIDQHEFFSKFNKKGLNTLRVCLYRSVKDNTMHILNVALRMGKGGSLDNETAGGIVCFINSNGSMNHFAVDKYGQKFDCHPDTGIVFGDKNVIPEFDKLKGLSLELAEQVFLGRIISLDMCYDIMGNWRAIEINLFRQTIRFAQYAGYPFFGKYTTEVIDYCKENPWWL